MKNEQRSRNSGRSIGAVLAGFVVVVVLSLGTDMAMRALGIFPPLGQRMTDALFVLATFYRTVVGVVGSYITARLAPYRPMLHALWGGLIGFVLSIVGAVVTWNDTATMGPHWIHSCSLCWPCPQLGPVANCSNCKLEVPVIFTKEELISSLQNEVRILLHLAGKVDRSKLDYRPTAKQRSTLELLQYMAIMGPTQVAVIRAGIFKRPELSAAWTPAVKASKEMDFDQAVAAIEKQAEEYERVLGEWTEADFRGEVDMFGTITTRGSLLVNLVLSGFAAYRTQLFCYLKSCGREELSTMNLWGGMDRPT